MGNANKEPRRALPERTGTLEDLNRTTPVPRGRAPGIRNRLGLPPRRFPISKKICGTLTFWTSKISGGKEAFLYICEMAALEGSEPCDAIVTKYLTLTKTEQRQVTLDDLCESLNIRASHVLRDALGTMAEHNLEGSKLAAAIAQPEIVDTAIRNAKKADSEFFKDRKLLLEATGFSTPAPLVNLDLRKQMREPAEPDGSGIDSFEDRIRRGAQAVRGDES